MLAPVRLPLAMLLVATVLVAPAAAAQTKVKRRSTVSLEGAWDTNARRVQAGTDSEPDVLAYLFATTNLEARAKRRIFRLDAELGGKLFYDVRAEDTLAGRLRLSLDQALARRVVAAFEAGYKDKYQRGDTFASVQGTEYECYRPETLDAESHRCNARDYRAANIGAALDILAGPGVTVRARVGANAFQYKPSNQFSYLSPDGGLTVRYRLGRRHAVAGFTGLGHRFYHPDSVTWTQVPSASGFSAVPVDTPRREVVLSGGVLYDYRGPVLVTVTWTLMRTWNNSFALDAIRNRIEVTGAFKIVDGTTLVFSGAFQSAYYPEGNVLRGLSLVGDESESQNSLALKLSQRLHENVALIFKLQGYTNELSEDALPFLRGVAHLGVEVSF